MEISDLGWKPDDDCEPWPGARPGRNGWKRVGTKVMLAHRWVWSEAYGPIPDGMLICHRCDNPACVKLSHLFMGTHRDNMTDAVMKGRMRGPLGLDP